MQIFIRDSWRNVTKLAAGMDAKDVFMSLKVMSKPFANNPFAEIQCDQEFMDALNAEALRNPDCKIVEAKDSGRSSMTPGGIVQHATFDGIPIVVSLANPAPPIADPGKVYAVEPSTTASEV